MRSVCCVGEAQTFVTMSKCAPTSGRGGPHPNAAGEFQYAGIVQTRRRAPAVNPSPTQAHASAGEGLCAQLPRPRLRGRGRGVRADFARDCANLDFFTASRCSGLRLFPRQ